MSNLPEKREFPVIPENLPERLKILRPRTPFSTVGKEVYCNLDRFQCIPVGQVPNFDKYIYHCPECNAMYEVLGQDFVDWCQFRDEIKRYVDE